ncbi:MAG: hypothetical protein ACUVX8_01710 [Candidatus Zipacnadales bacterium]
MRRIPSEPNYTTARLEAGFQWSVGSSQGALRELTGIPIREFNLDPEACIEAYRRGRPLIREMFGEDVSLPGLTTPAISYGHANCLGSELLFPEGGEVAHTHIYKSLEEGLKALRQPTEWDKAGMAPFYLAFRERMREAFPGERVGFSFGLEGPITTAYELRGEGFFIDIFEDLALAKEFLRVLTDSILDFHGFLCEVEGRLVINPHSAGICDDLASFIPPRLMGELVVPYWNQYFAGMTTGARSAHVENLRAEQLGYLEQVGIVRFDPSISPQLTPRIIFEHCRVPFFWRLGCFHYRDMSCQDVEDFVYQSAADGASGVITYVAETLCNEEGVTKIHAFIRAAKKAKRLIDEGCPREELAQLVSADGRQKLWDQWCGRR